MYNPNLQIQQDDGYTETLTSNATPSVPASNQNQPRQAATDATLSALVIEDASAVDDSDNDETLRIEFRNLPAGVGAGNRSRVTVNLDDNDDGNSSQRFTNGDMIRILNENIAPNHDVGLPITVTDADNDTLTYTIDGLDKDRFTVVSTNGQIRTKAGQTYDYEIVQTFVVKVVANDGNGGTATAIVVIRIADINEPPSAPTSFTLVVQHL